MTIANAREMMMEAVQGGYAVGAFNITSIVQMLAVVEAAVEKRAPVIIQTSVKPSQFLSKEVIVGAYRTLARAAPVPVSLHLDHCNEQTYCKECADAGYTSIMIDASKLAFEENIRQTRAVADYCHSLESISVEGELGTIGGVELAEGEMLLANPEQAVEFVERSGVDIFAPAIGTAHGVYKTRNPRVDFERLGTIHKMLNSSRIRVPLVVHGGTGLPEDYVKQLIKMGGAKFNVSTELKHILIDTTYSYIADKRDEYDPGRIDAAVRDAIRGTVGHWIDMLRSTGKA